MLSLGRSAKPIQIVLERFKVIDRANSFKDVKTVSSLFVDKIKFDT